MKPESVEVVETTGAAERALDILEFLEAHDDAQTLTQITSGLNLPKASAYRLLGTLRSRGYVEQLRPRGGYSLGLRVLRLAVKARQRVDLVRVAQPFLKLLAEQTGESCQVSVRSGVQALCVARVASSAHPYFSLAGDVGSVFPLHAAAVGKVLLAYAPADERSAYLERELASFTPQTHASASSLIAELEGIRAAGLAEDHEEFKRGLSALAVPVFDHEGEVSAALALPFFAPTPGDLDTGLPEKIAALRATALEISLGLGASPPVKAS